MYFLVSRFWEKIVQLDHSLFLKINHDSANVVFDKVMPFLRNSIIWAPLYLFVLVFMIINFRLKGLWSVVFFLSTVAMTDLTGTYVFKHAFERLRPCNDPDFAYQVRLLLKQCAGGYSFISNHAANHFGMAAFFLITTRHFFKKWVWLAILWAALVCYAQVYVGVHYPLDVLVGSLLGIAFGITTGTFFNKRFGLAIFDNQPI